MMHTETMLDKITAQALHLPPVQKIQLVERLMVTLQQELKEPAPKVVASEPKSSVSPVAEEMFKQKLLEIGLLTEIKSPAHRAAKRPVPLRVTGKPLSEIVIEDRR